MRAGVLAEGEPEWNARFVSMENAERVANVIVPTSGLIVSAASVIVSAASR
jgi:hypothetical protein